MSKCRRWDECYSQAEGGEFYCLTHLNELEERIAARQETYAETNTKILDIHHIRGCFEWGYVADKDSVRVIVDAADDLEKPFTGECWVTGEYLHFRHPWALDIEVVGNGISAVI